MAAVDGPRDRRNHSNTKSTPLRTYSAGTRVAGEIRRIARPCRNTSAIENSAVAVTIAGSAVIVSDVKNRASRVALPAASWAAMTPAAIIANDMEREV